MADQEVKKQDAFVPSYFQEATEPRRHFKAGTIVQLTEGEFLNYEAAGLVRTPTDEDKAEARKAAAADKSAAKAA
ncbi:hypothetical protein [uncultured Sphingomonas sp.]|uniref:hypothetical protein n=1 Tax=uncultured Sphingomonas sp. TaxID=158754 RepID=UPI0025F86483|nr:hypothetical protein [uncultured Sphingomonas sp.]